MSAGEPAISHTAARTVYPRVVCSYVSHAPPCVVCFRAIAQRRPMLRDCRAHALRSPLLLRDSMMTAPARAVGSQRGGRDLISLPAALAVLAASLAVFVRYTLRARTHTRPRRSLTPVSPATETGGCPAPLWHPLSSPLVSPLPAPHGVCENSTKPVVRTAVTASQSDIVTITVSLGTPTGKSRCRGLSRENSRRCWHR